MSAALLFTLGVPHRKQIRGLGVTRTSFRFHGQLRLEGPLLHIEWVGTMRIKTVEAFNVRDETEGLPNEALDLWVTQLHSAKLQGRWHPRVVVAERQIGALGLVPSESQGEVVFWVSRQDRGVAKRFVRALTKAIAASARIGATSETETQRPRTPPQPVPVERPTS
jgi:hypothetical protein